MIRLCSHGGCQQLAAYSVIPVDHATVVYTMDGRAESLESHEPLQGCRFHIGAIIDENLPCTVFGPLS